MADQEAEEEGGIHAQQHTAQQLTAHGIRHTAHGVKHSNKQHTATAYSTQHNTYHMSPPCAVCRENPEDGTQGPQKASGRSRRGSVGNSRRNSVSWSMSDAAADAVEQCAEIILAAVHAIALGSRGHFGIERFLRIQGGFPALGRELRRATPLLSSTGCVQPLLQTLYAWSLGGFDKELVKRNAKIS